MEHEKEHSQGEAGKNVGTHRNGSDNSFLSACLGPGPPPSQATSLYRGSYSSCSCHDSRRGRVRPANFATESAIRSKAVTNRPIVSSLSFSARVSLMGAPYWCWQRAKPTVW